MDTFKLPPEALDELRKTAYDPFSGSPLPSDKRWEAWKAKYGSYLAQAPKHDTQAEDAKYVDSMLPVVIDAAKKGMVSPEEFDLAFGARNDAGGNDYTRTRFRIDHLLNNAVERYSVFLAGSKRGDLGNYATAAAQTYGSNFVLPMLQYAETVVGYAASLQTAARLGGADPFKVGATIAVDAKRRRENADRMFLRDLGVPEDDKLRNLFFANSPVARLTGSLTGTLLSLASPGVKQLPTVFASIPALARVPTAIKGLGLAGSGAALGWTYESLLGPEDATYFDKSMAALTGAGAGLFAASVFGGRPIGAAVREVMNAEQVGRIGLSGLGNLLMTSPRLTTGSMLGMGLQGGVLATLDATGQGADTFSSVQAGLEGAFGWIIADVLGAGIGSTVRWAAVQANAGQRIAKALQEYSTLSTISQLGIGGGLGAYGGYEAGKAVDHPITGAVAGGILGVGILNAGLRRLANARYYLGDEIVGKFMRGEFSALDAKERAQVVKQLVGSETRAAVTDVVGPDDVAHRAVAEEALGLAEKSDPEIAVMLRETEAELRTLMPAEMIPPTALTDPTVMPRIIALSQRAGWLRESLAKRAETLAARVVPGSTRPITPSELKREIELLPASGPVNPIIYGTPSGLRGATAAAANKVAPAGAGGVKGIVAATISQQAKTSKELSLKDVREWAGALGLTAHVESVGKNFQFVLKDEAGKAVFTGTAAEIQRFIGQRGAIGPSALTAAAMTGLGSVLGPVAVQALDLDDDITPGQAALAGGLTGAVLSMGAMGYLARKNAGIFARPWPAGEGLLKLARVPEHLRLDVATERKLVGKTGESGPTVTQFWRMSGKAQVDHILARVEKFAQKQYETHEERIEEVLGFIRRYVPTHFDSTADFDRLRTKFYDVMKELGHEDAQTAMSWRGYLVQLATHYNYRPWKSDFNLMTLGRDGRAFGGETNLDEIRRIVLNADVLTGPEITFRGDAVARAANLIHKSLTIDAKHLKEAEAQAARFSTETYGVATGDVLSRNIFNVPGTHKLASINTFRTTGERLLRSDKPGERGLGKLIYGWFDDVSAADVTVRRNVQEYTKKFLDVYGGLPIERQKRIRDLVENDDLLLAAKATDRDGYERAIKVREIFRDYRDNRFKFDELVEEINRERVSAGQKPITKDVLFASLGVNNPEAYHRIVYNQHSIREMIRKGNVPDTYILHPDMGPLQAQQFHALRMRMTDGKLADRIAPIDEALLYVHGAERKLAMDQLWARYDVPWFKKLAGNYGQPYYARDMLRYMLDMAGVPRESVVESLVKLRGVGIRIEEMVAKSQMPGWLAGYVTEINERYFLDPKAAYNFANFARGWAAMAKLGGSLITSMVNLSGALVDVGMNGTLSDMFYAGKAGATAGIGTAVDDLPIMLPFLNLEFKGPGKWQIMKERGWVNDTGLRMIGEIGEGEIKKLGARPGLVAGSALLGGVTGGAATGLATDEEHSVAGAVTGAAVGGALSVAFPLGVRRALLAGKTAFVLPFAASENAARAIARTSFERLGARAAEIEGAEGAVKARLIAKAKGAHAVESGLLGAVALGGSAAYQAEEGQRGVAALTGAAVGGALGVLARGKTPELEAAETIAWRSGMKRALDIPDEDVIQWFSRMATDRSLFRFSRAGRPELMRTPLGEVAGALQTWTINQTELLGAAWKDMFDGIAKHGMAGVASGQVDMRIFRYMALLTTASSVYSMIAGGMESERGQMYWSTRIGLGLLPFLAYNESAERWAIVDPGRVVMGPVFGDVLRTFRTVKTLLTDPIAARRFDEHLNELAKALIPAFRQFEYIPEKAGAALETARLERASELARQAQDVFSAFSNPGVALTSTSPPAPGARTNLSTAPRRRTGPLGIGPDFGGGVGGPDLGGGVGQ